MRPLPEIPKSGKVAFVDAGGVKVRLTNLEKPFWPEEGITKSDLLRYYAQISDVLLPHIADRAMVMKRYPHGAGGEFFFMKRAPTPRPDWIQTCPIDHGEEKIIDFPVIRDLASLLWVINLGCIDLNQWYARCDDVDRPDYVHFDLDPVPDAGFDKVREAALLVKKALDALAMPSYAKTTGSKGIHVYVPIVRGPRQKQVWDFARKVSIALELHQPKLVTTEYTVAKRPKGRVLVDFNQNAWGRTLASVYSVRPKPRAPVSAPVTWEEVEKGINIEDFRIDNMRARVDEVGDLFHPLLEEKGRVNIEKYG